MKSIIAALILGATCISAFADLGSPPQGRRDRSETAPVTTADLGSPPQGRRDREVVLPAEGQRHRISHTPGRPISVEPAPMIKLADLGSPPQGRRDRAETAPVTTA